jgi:DNA-binding LytR/AlgR family response regulator
MHCIVIDDDDLSRYTINTFVEKTNGLVLAGSFSRAKDAIDYLEKNQVDLVFLDVEMPEMTGLEFLSQYKGRAQVVMVTVNREYAAAAFDYNVTDFLLKPVDYSRFVKSLEKVRRINENLIPGENDKEVFIKKDNKLIRMPLDEIHYVEALADYVNLYTQQGRHTILSTMKAIENKLPGRDFCRVHRSFIVRLDKIKEIEDNNIHILDKEIPISRSYKDALLDKLNLF